MKKFLMALAILCVASPAFATGPNEGGTLVVHDTGFGYSAVADLPVPPPTTPPATCDGVDGVDINMERASDALNMWVWKVYAAFPDGSNPRLKGLAWGISGVGGIYVTAAGLPDPPNCFQVVQGSWPSPPGSIGQSFVFPQTTQLVECYWFGGYAYNASVFSTAPHQTSNSQFVDDATPGNLDDIAGFSSLGFGVDGVLVCPSIIPPEGACCYPDGSCVMVLQDACVDPGVWFGGSCDVVVCPIIHYGACCLANELCEVLRPAECAALGGEYKGDETDCDPNPCIIIPTEPTSWGQIKANYR